MITKTLLVKCIVAAFAVAIAFAGALFASAAAPTGTDAEVTNSTATTVDIVITGTDFDQFISSQATNANATDLAKISYRGANPLTAVIDNATTITAIFAINAIGTDKAGSLTIAAGAVEDSSNVANGLITIVDADITDTAQPQFVSAATIDNDNDGTVDFIGVEYSEPVSDLSISAADFATGTNAVTAGLLIETVTSAPTTGNLVNVVNDEIIYVGVASGSETLSAFKTDYTLHIAQVGPINDRATNPNTLTSFTEKTSTDNARPLIVSVTPVDASTDVIRSTDVEITFSEPMVQGSVDFFTDATGITFTDTWSVGDTVVSFSPSANFGWDTLINATVDTATAAGGVDTSLLGTPYNWSFTTADRPSSGGGGSSIRYGCTDESATNYKKNVRHKADMCTYAEVTVPTPTTPVTVAMPSAAHPIVSIITDILRPGARGNDVMILQQFLMAQNVGPAAMALPMRGGADGVYGPATTAAVAEWQTKYGLLADGKFGPYTRAVMLTK